MTDDLDLAAHLRDAGEIEMSERETAGEQPMQTEPLSAARLQEIRERLDRTPAIPFTLDDEAGIARVRMSEVRWAVYAMRDLLAEHDRQAAEVERLRAAHLRDAGNAPEDTDLDPFCYTCVSSGTWVECDNCEDGWVEGDDDGYTGGTEFEPCQWCDGRGGYWECLGSAHHDLNTGSIHATPLDKRGPTAPEEATQP